MSEQTIPVLDLKQFVGAPPKDRVEFVEALGESLTSLGFFALTHHGIDPDLIRRAYAICETFFSQPERVKKRYEFEELMGQRGFTSFGREHAKGMPAPDLKEFWHVGRELEEQHPLLSVYGPNIWPLKGDCPSDFRSVFLELYRQLDVCAAHLLEACSLFLGERGDLLPKMAVNGDTILRVIHYPPVAEDRDPASVRAGAHEDINLITLLCEATAEGLELLDRNGAWRPIRALEGQIIVDAGDMIQNLTNGLLKSTTHRVVNPDNDRQRRFSMPFFVHPRAEVDLSPLATSVKRSGGVQEYPSIGAREFLCQRLAEIGLDVEAA